MPTVIDSLLLQVGFDTSGVKKGQEEANKALKDVKDSATSTAKEMQSRGAQAGEFFASIRNQLLGATAALIGFKGVEHAVNETVTSVAALGRAAAVTGANVKELSAFAMAIERNGGSAAAATQEIEGFVAAVTKWQTLGEGSRDLSMFYGTIGAGLHTSPFDALKLYAQYADKHGNDPALVKQLGAGVGFGDPTIAMLLKGGANFDAEMARSRELGVATDADIKAARELQQSFTALQQAMDTFTRHLVTQNEGWMKWILDRLTKDFTDGPQGGIVGDSSRALGRQLDQASKGGILVDPYSGVIVPFDPASGGSTSTLDLFRKLESSGDSAISRKGAQGRYQVLPSTAEQYGFDPTRLTDPAYNTQVASAILADLSKRYNGDTDAMAIAYHSGPGAADKWLSGGRNDAMLGPRTRDYLSRERAFTGGTATTTIQNLNVYSQAKDGKGIAGDIRASLSSQANTGLQ